MFSQATLGNILIIDDDRAVTDLLCLNLSSEGYRVVVRESPDEITPVDLRDLHLLIIDCGAQGCQFMQDFRSTPTGMRAGAIFYSNLDSERMLIDALDAGADDVVRKPFSLREMIARIRAVLRRRGRSVSSISEASIINFKQLKVDLTNKTAFIDDAPINLSNTEFSILEMLLRNANSYTPRIEIFRTVWPDGTGANERIVDTNISRLRRKLGPMAGCIVNRSGMGYMISE